MKKILTIDDQQSNLITIKAIIERFLPEYKVLMALSGKEGIELAKNEQPDTILLDIVMPQMDGFEVCKRLKSDESTKHIPVVMITALKVDTASRIKGLEAGADAFLTKPIDPGELMAQVKVMLRIKEAEDKLQEDKEQLNQMVRERTQELKEKEEKYLVMADLLPQIVFEYDLNGNLTYLNKQGIDSFGYSQKDIEKGVNVLDGFIPEDRKRMKVAIQRILVGEELINSEYTALRKDGSTFFVLITSNIIFKDNKAVGARGVAIDITERIRTKELLFNLNMAINNAYEVIFMTDKNGIITFINSGFTKMYGYTADEVVGKTTPRILKSDIFTREDYEQFWKALFDKKDIPTSQYVNKCKNGKLIDVEGSANPIINDNGDITGFLGIQRDITERKLTEERFRESEEKYRTAFQTSPDAVNINRLDGLYIDINEGFTKLTGFTRDDVIGKLSSEINIWAIAKDRETLVKGLKEKGFVDNLESKFRCKDGFLKTALMSANTIMLNNVPHILSITRDITQYKQAENEIKTQKKLFETMFNSITDGVVITNSDREIILANKGMKSTFGYEPPELIGKTTELLYADKSKFVDTGEKVFDKNKPSNNRLYLTYYKDKDGNTFPGETFGTKLFDSNGEWIGNLGIMRNISERQKLMSDLTIAKEHAEESDRLKSAFLANMSHEIRTPMNGILGFAGLLKEPGLSGDEQQEYISVIEKSGARMLNIINNIVDISKIEAGLMEVALKETNINEQIEYIYNFFKPEVEAKGIQLFFKTGLPTKESIIKTDREKVYGILINLVKNAIKYSNKGSIEFGYRIVEAFHETSLQFYVKDTGIGIPKDRQKAIFERFVQADIEDKMATQGAGLGLAISKAYVEMLGGKIWVESTDGEGSVFYFTLPYNIEWQTKSIVKNIPMENGGTKPVKKLKIIIVDDDETSTQLITIALKRICKEVLIATTGTEAVEMCRNHPDIDLVLMDIQLPVISGYEATRQIRQFNKEVIIIAQTAFALAGDREKAIAAGCNDYISKPLNKEEMIGMIGRLSGHPMVIDGH